MDNIRTIKEQGSPYFAEAADCLLALMEAADAPVLTQAHHDRIYDRFAPETYEQSFLNPQYAAAVLGEAGSLLSAVYADIASLLPYAARSGRAVIDLFAQLLVELWHAGEERLEYDAQRRVFYDFYKSNSAVFVEESILAKIDPSQQFYFDIVMHRDFCDPAFLYEYGLYIGENEKRLSAFLQTLSQEEIQAMADTFVEGYRKGFEVTRRDISKKKTVNVEFPVGMERVIRAAVEGFAKLGLKATFLPTAQLSFQGRGGEKRGVYATSVNPQFDFDHKNDKGYYLDRAFLEQRLSLMERVYEANRTLSGEYGGPAVTEVFGQADFTPQTRRESYTYTEEQNQAQVWFSSRAGKLTDTYIPGDEYSFTIISYPLPSIGADFEAIFRETVRINTLDYKLYRDMQQKLIDVLDQGEKVRVRGSGANQTDITVMLHTLSDPARETNFENCVADVNIPVGEVFTSPVLEGTNGVLHVSEVFLGIYQYKNLKFTFKDGVVQDYTCDNFEDEKENRKLIFDSIMHHHAFLPIGEFAIGTNSEAFMMARRYGIQSKLPILIAEKTGPHFAVGDTCYSYAEDMAVYNPDGKEIIARSNSFADLRETEPEKAYFNCHTDITIPYDELKEITVLCRDGRELPILLDGRFVVPGTEKLNEPLERG